MDNLYVRYKTCKEHTKSLMAESPAFRKIFLSQQLIDAMNQQKTDDAKRIKEIIKREAHKRESQGIYCVVKPNKTGAVSHVDVPLADRSTWRCSKKEDVDKAIGQNIMARSTQAKSAPIYQGALFDLLGYRADTETAMKI